MYSPRMRGGQPESITHFFTEVKFSPHARGSTPQKIEDVWAKRFTPHARGSTLEAAFNIFIYKILLARAGVNLLQKNA